MEHNLLQRLQHDPESRIQRSCSNPHNTTSSSSNTNSNTISNTASFFGLRRLSLAKLWLLSVLLLITIAASSWPTGTSAAPRVASGWHLILKSHRNSPTQPAAVTTEPPAPLAAKASAAHPHHKHSKGKRHQPLVVRREVPTVAPILFTNQTAGMKNCEAMKTKAKEVVKLEKALKKAQNYKDTVICITEDYLYNFFKGSNIKAHSVCHLHQRLDLDHPLKHKARNVIHSPEGKFEYKGPVGKLEEEMPKIIETLLVLEALINSIPYGEGEENCTFKYIRQAVQSNTASAMEMMDGALCNPPKEVHCNMGVVHLPFHAAMETIKVLAVLEYTYEQLLNANPLRSFPIEKQAIPKRN